MKPMETLSFCLSVAALSFAGGCATPKPVLDLSSQGVATVGLAEISLRDYLQLANAQVEARTNLVRDDVRDEVLVRNRQNLADFISTQAGNSEDTSTFDMIKNLAAERQKLREAGEAALAEVDKKFSVDALQAAKVPTERLGQAKAAFAMLAQELTAKEWMALASGYAKEIRKVAKALRRVRHRHQPDQRYGGSEVKTPRSSKGSPPCVQLAS